MVVERLATSAVGVRRREGRQMPLEREEEELVELLLMVEEEEEEKALYWVSLLPAWARLGIGVRVSVRNPGVREGSRGGRGRNRQGSSTQMVTGTVVRRPRHLRLPLMCFEERWPRWQLKSRLLECKLSSATHAPQGVGTGAGGRCGGR